jgi:hypothetical protein
VGDKDALCIRVLQNIQYIFIDEAVNGITQLKKLSPTDIPDQGRMGWVLRFGIIRS